MENEKQNNQPNEKKGFFAKLIDKFDKKLEEKSQNCCCCQKGKTEEKSC